MNFFTAFRRKLDAMLSWLCSYRRYRLIAVSALTGGWMYLDAARNQICWVQSPLVDAGTPLEISVRDAQTMLNPESGLGWDKVTPDDRTWYSDVDQLVAVAKSELAKRGASINEVA